MRRFFLFVAISAASSFSFAQKIDKQITEQEVGRVLKTLSSDEMKGRPAMEPEIIENATRFIESEFRSIGLKPLSGLSSYRQEFEKDMIETLPGGQYVVNGRSVQAAVTISGSTDIAHTTDLQIQRIRKKDNFFQFLRKQLRNDSVSTLLVVDSAHMKSFSQVQERFNGKRIFDQSGKNRTLIIVVTGDTTVSSYDVRVKQKISRVKMTNVVGQLIASPATDESVVFSGHYDHLGVLKAVAGDSIANGADDDASGTTAVITLARYFKSVKDIRRNLIFVAFTAEEIGGYGSQYFSKNLNADKVVAMFNIEMIGKPSKWGGNAAFITGFERSTFGKILQQNLAGSRYEFHPDPYPEQNLFYRSDNATLARLGVPAHTISSDMIDVDKYYHTVDDEFSTTDVTNATALIRAIAISATSIISGKDTPTRIDAKTVEK